MSELYVDGKKVVGSTPIQSITTLQNGYTGTVVWVVTNGICTVTTYGIYTTSSFTTSVPICDGLPKAKITVIQDVIAQVVPSVDFNHLYINEASTTLMGRSSANKTMWSSLTYPVADDWHE